MQEKIRCSVCGVNLNEGNALEFEGNIYCDDCLSEQTVLCMNCNERILREEAEGNSDYHVREPIQQKWSVIRGYSERTH